MTSTNKPKRIALFLMLFFSALSVTLVNATTESNYRNDTNLLPQLHESTHTENGYRANIIINPTTGIYARENGYNLDLAINPEGIGGKLIENNYQLDLIPEKTFPDIPDLAVTNVIPSKTIVGRGYTITIEATVKNEGFYFETFNVTAYANTTIIQTKTITLTGKSSTTITFTWQTGGVPYGNYPITATATSVPSETDLTDNAKTDGWVKVTRVGNVNGDGAVNVLDVILVLINLGSVPPKPPECDINGDRNVNVLDVILVLVNVGPV